MWTKVFLVLVFLCYWTIVIGQNIYELQKCNGRPSFLDTLTVCKALKKSMVFTTGLKYKQGLFFTSSNDIFGDICHVDKNMLAISFFAFWSMARRYLHKKPYL